MLGCVYVLSVLCLLWILMYEAGLRFLLHFYMGFAAVWMGRVKYCCKELIAKHTEVY